MKLPFLAIVILLASPPKSLAQEPTLPDTSASFESQVMEGLRSGSLPEGFIQIAQKTATGKYEILSGGGLVAPGAAIAPTIAPIDSLREDAYFYNDYEDTIFFGSGKQKLYPVDGLYILFTTQGKKVPVKIQRIRRYSYGGVMPHGQYMDFSLHFFDPHPEIAHLRPIPIVNSEDFSSWSDVVGEVFTAGERTYENKEIFYQWIQGDDGQQEFCQSVDGTPVRFGRSYMRFTPDEAELIWTMIDSYHGQLKEFVSDSLKPRFTKDSSGRKYARSIYQRWKKVFLLDPSSPLYFASNALLSAVVCQGFCIEGPLYQDLREGDLTATCAKSHRSRTGYPVLWKTPSSKIKMVGLAGGRRILSKAHDPFSKLGKPNFHGVYYLSAINLLLYLPYIRSEILLYNKHVRKQFDTFHAKKELNQYIEDPREGTLIKSLPFVVAVRASGKDGSTRGIACSGAYIEKGVVLTAAHCLMKYRRKSILHHGFHLEFKVGEKIYVTQAKTWVMHPKYRLKGSTLNSTPDIALIFFHESENFPDIMPASLLPDTPKQQLHEYEILKLSYMEPWSVEGKRLRSHQYKVVSADIISGSVDFTMRRYQTLMKSPRYHQVILPYVKNMIGRDVADSFLTDKVLKLIQADKSLTFLSDVCTESSILCLTATNDSTFMEKSHFTCDADSGGPILARHGGDLMITGVHVQGGGGLFQTRRCDPMSMDIYLHPYLDWIQKTIAWQKDRRPLLRKLFLQKLWDRLLSH